MDLDEAVVVLSTPASPRWGDALEALRQFVEAGAMRARASRMEAEDISQGVVLKLLPRLQAGEIPWAPGAHRAYLRGCAKNAVIDDLRRTGPVREQALGAEEIPDGGGDAAPEVTEIVDAAWELLERVASQARKRRAARYRAEFDRTWGELCALARGASLRELLGSRRQTSTEAEKSFFQARDAAYKAHERMRSALLVAVQELRSTGQLTEADATRASQALRVFVRCQRRPQNTVLPKKGPG